MERNISGIYSITNSINNKIYIGSAVCIKQRFIQHKSDLEKQKHNKRLQNFVNKYGIEVLKFNIVELVLDVNDLISREQFWIDYYESWRSKRGFNICKVAGSTLGLKMTDSHKDACRKRMIGNKHSEGRKWTEEEKKEIGERSKQFWKNNPSKKENMVKTLSEQRKGKPQWVDTPHPMLGKFGEDNPNYGKKRTKEFCELMRKRALENNGMKGVKLPQERINQISESKKKPVALIDDEGNILKEYESQKEATIELELTQGAVARVCKGEYKQTKGYRFKYL
jgi:group I intron endonuclease